jgi:RTX calcium-binding nonapeptide repeat (4 copies)
VLIGSEGNDTLTGGGGANRFVYAESGAANVDTITDYRASSGDVIGLSALLDAAFGPTSNVADFGRLLQSGSDITVQVDVDGTVGGGKLDGRGHSQRLRDERDGSGPRLFRQHEPRHVCVSSKAVAPRRVGSAERQLWSARLQNHSGLRAGIFTTLAHFWRASVGFLWGS